MPRFISLFCVNVSFCFPVLCKSKCLVLRRFVLAARPSSRFCYKNFPTGDKNFSVCLHFCDAFSPYFIDFFGLGDKITKKTQTYTPPARTLYAWRRNTRPVAHGAQAHTPAQFLCNFVILNKIIIYYVRMPVFSSPKPETKTGDKNF